MKNILSENMQRFGTKNLTEAAKKKLMFKSIMETIDQHGLHKAVKTALTEQAMSTVERANDRYLNQYFKPNVTFGIKDGNKFFMDAPGAQGKVLSTITGQGQMPLGAYNADTVASIIAQNHSAFLTRPLSAGQLIAHGILTALVNKARALTSGTPG
jgi:hypothetical protein